MEKCIFCSASRLSFDSDEGMMEIKGIKGYFIKASTVKTDI